MLDVYLMTICGDKAATMGMRCSAIYNWARHHSVAWNVIVTAQQDVLLIAVLNDITLDAAKTLLENA